MTQEHRYRINLLAEKVMLIVDPSPELSGERDTLQQSLEQYLDSQRDMWNMASKVGFKSLTRSEQLAGHAYHAMALILRASHDKDQWAETNFQSTLDGYNNDLVESLDEQLALIQNLKEPIPAFGSTLHALCTVDAVGRTMMGFC